MLSVYLDVGVVDDSKQSKPRGLYHHEALLYVPAADGGLCPKVPLGTLMRSSIATCHSRAHIMTDVSVCYV